MFIGSFTGPALGQVTGPITGPTTNLVMPSPAGQLDKYELAKVLETRDPDVKINWRKDKDGNDQYFTYTFRQLIAGMVHRIVVVCLPNKNRIEISVTLSQPLSLQRELEVRGQIVSLNSQLAGSGRLDLDDKDHFLLIFTVLEWTSSRSAFEAKLDQLLRCVERTESLWSRLR